MRSLLSLLLCLVITGFLPGGNVQAEDADQAMRRIGSNVAELELGFGDYVLGRQLNDNQRALAKKNRIAKTLNGTIKFRDGEVFVVAKEDDSMVIGIYKQYEQVDRTTLKGLVGEFMFRFNEPTTMAHSSMIYWAYNKSGKVTEDEYNFAKQTGESDIIATVKFQSTLPIVQDSPEAADPASAKNSETVKEIDEKADVYVIITSNPLSKIFLAQQN